jgi:hypothetical protein
MLPFLFFSPVYCCALSHKTLLYFSEVSYLFFSLYETQNDQHVSRRDPTDWALGMTIFVLGGGGYSALEEETPLIRNGFPVGIHAT